MTTMGNAFFRVAIVHRVSRRSIELTNAPVIKLFLEVSAKKVKNGGLCAITEVESLLYKLLGGFTVRRYNKSLLGDDCGKFPAPLLLKTVHFTVQAVLSKGTVWFWPQRFQATVPMSRKDYFLRGKKNPHSSASTASSRPTEGYGVQNQFSSSISSVHMPTDGYVPKYVIMIYIDESNDLKWISRDFQLIDRSTMNLEITHFAPKRDELNRTSNSAQQPTPGIIARRRSVEDRQIQAACDLVSVFGVLVGFLFVTKRRLPRLTYAYVRAIWFCSVKSILKGHQKKVTGLAFSNVLNVLVSSGADAQLYVWSIDGWEMQGRVELQIPSGRTLAPVSQTRVQFQQDQVHLLFINENQLAIYEMARLELSKQWVPRELHGPIADAT